MADVSNIVLERLEDELEERLGEGTVVYEEDGIVHLYNENPDAGFEGLSDSPLFSTNLLLDENDDSKHRRIERFGDWVVALDIDEFRGTPSYVSGQALRCEPGSEAQREFVRTAVVTVCAEAADPLRSVLRAAKDAGIELDTASRQALLAALFAKD